jgi:hypothetical protein
MPELEIKLMEKPDRSRFLRVRLGSEMRRGVIAQTDVPYQGTEARTTQAVLAAGGALAEYLEQTHGDNFDSGDIARKATELFKELIMEVNQRSH